MQPGFMAIVGLGLNIYALGEPAELLQSINKNMELLILFIINREPDPIKASEYIILVLYTIFNQDDIGSYNEYITKLNQEEKQILNVIIKDLADVIQENNKIRIAVAFMQNEFANMCERLVKQKSDSIGEALFYFNPQNQNAIQFTLLQNQKKAMKNLKEETKSFCSKYKVRLEKLS